MPQPLTDDWRDWLRLNRDRGCDREKLFRKAVREGFDPQAIALELGDLQLALPTDEGRWEAWSRPPLANASHQPRAWRLDTDLAQLYEIPSLLTPVETGGETVFARIGRSFTPATGLALAWNNLHASGVPNHATLHEAMPVLSGRKYVITKWFRAETGRCSS